MKQLNSKSMPGNSLTAFSLALCLFLAGMANLQAGKGNGMEPEEEESEKPYNIVVGSFDGLEPKMERIWINDRVYKLDHKVRVRVKGPEKKLGMIADLEQGETIKATLRRNEDQPILPYVRFIERQ